MSYIKLDRAIKNWRYKTRPDYVALWIDLLVSANWEEKQWQEEVIKKGEFITSLEQLNQQTGLSVQTIRTILKKLKGNEINVKSTNKYTKITIIKWEDYQSLEENQQSTNNQLTNNQQSTNNQLTTTKEYKEDKEYKELKEKEIYKEKETKNCYGEYGHVRLTQKERDKLDKDYGYEIALKSIDFLDKYIEERGYKSKSHNLSIRRWVIDAITKDKKKGGLAF